MRMAHIEDFSDRLGGMRFLSFDLRSDRGFDRRLTRLLLSRERKVPRDLGYNVFDWISTDLSRVRGAIERCVRVYHEIYGLPPARRGSLRIKGLVRVALKGNHVGLHDHVGSGFLTGVYYGQTARDPRGEDTTYVFPLRGRRTAELSLAPAPGTLLLYESGLKHYSPPHPDSRAKVVLAFDIALARDAGPFYAALTPGKPS